MSNNNITVNEWASAAAGLLSMIAVSENVTQEIREVATNAVMDAPTSVIFGAVVEVISLGPDATI